jgi:hypothetical protein
VERVVLRGRVLEYEGDDEAVGPAAAQVGAVADAQVQAPRQRGADLEGRKVLARLVPVAARARQIAQAAAQLKDGGEAHALDGHQLRGIGRQTASSPSALGAAQRDDMGIHG